MSAERIEQSKHLWDAMDLVRRLGNALEIAERAVRLLAPSGYQDPNDPTVGVSAEKVVSETVLLLLACTSVAAQHTDIGSRLQKIARLLIPYARNEQVIISMCLNPGLAYDYAFAHICLSCLGFLDTQFDRILHLCAETEVLGNRERLPHRTLEQEWLKRMWGSSNPRNRDEYRAAALSMLSRSIDPFTSSRDDIYAFTHAIMYISDLGGRTSRLPRAKGDILADAETALSICLDQQDYDLCGEILLTWPYLGAKWSATAAFAFRVLMRVEDAVGFLPAPLTRLDRYYALSDEERPRYALATVYHTAYVMGLLCAASLKHERTLSVMIPRSRTLNRYEILLKVIDSYGNKPHWRDDFIQLETKSQNALAPMLMTIALRHAVTGHNLEQVRSLLAFGMDNGILNYPATRQAAGLLRRFAEVTLHSRELAIPETTTQRTEEHAGTGTHT